VSLADSSAIEVAVLHRRTSELELFGQLQAELELKLKLKHFRQIH
jgi:hypothetical protein